MENKIILIGGTAGVGKTTLSRKIAEQLALPHRIGTGFIREILRAYLSKKKFPSLYTYTFRPPKGKNVMENFKKQCKILHPAIKKIIKRAKNEGTSIVVEGNHLLPEYYKNEADIYFFIIKLSNSQELFKRLNGATHTKRKVLEKDLHQAINIQDYLVKTALKNKIKVIENIDLDDTIKQIVTLVRD